MITVKIHKHEQKSITHQTMRWTGYNSGGLHQVSLLLAKYMKQSYAGDKLRYDGM